VATRSKFLPDAGLPAAATVRSRPSRNHVGVATLKAIAMLRGVGLVVSLLLATNGLDLSLGPF
jgi:hypothetical protein